MILYLRSFAWLRWRLLVNTLRGGRRKDTLERFSAIAAVIVPALVMSVIVIASTVLGGLALVGGSMMASGLIESATVVLVARLILMIVMATLILVPLGRSMQGATLGITRLLLLPIPRAMLHATEVAAGLADPWVAVVIPALLLLPAGIAFGGRPGAAVLALSAAAALLLLLASFGAVLSFLFQWLLRDRRRGELVSFLFMFVMMFSGVVPMLLGWYGPNVKTKAEAVDTPRVSIPVRDLDRGLPGWTAPIPTELYGRALKRGLEGRTGEGLLAVAALLAEGLLLFGVSAVLHAKLMASPEVGGSSRRKGRRRGGPIRLPGLTPGASAVATALWTTCMRTVRGKLALFATGPMLLLIGLMTRRMPENAPIIGGIAQRGDLLLLTGLFFSLFSLSPILMNQFGVDGGGLTRQLVLPLSDRDLVWGKAAGVALMFGCSSSVSLVVSLLLAPRGSPLGWMTVILGGASSFFLVGAAASFLSVVFPKRSNLSAMGRAGEPHTAAALIGVLVVMLGAPPAMLIWFVADGILLIPWLALGLMALWTLVTGGIAAFVLIATAALLGRRRETMALIAAEK
ncbi:MAG TPA: hypothetical protein VFG76_06735 [Candidatus Polarisedimenticolia bacterium]|nr:hypothetical protein [Candidatus Polarisedimenticolia bacterium]